MNEALWLRIEEALDARRDPFGDECLAAALEAEPANATAGSVRSPANPAPQPITLLCIADLFPIISPPTTAPL